MATKIFTTIFFTFFSLILFAQPTSPESEFIKVDQFGYIPSMSKVAVISNPITGYNSNLSFTAGTSYQLRDWFTNNPILTAPPTAWSNGATHTQSGDRGWWFDFSTVTTPGSYYVYDVTNNVRSGRFEIADDVYALILKTTMRMYYYNRCYQSKQAPFAQANWTDNLAFPQDVTCRFVYNKNSVALEKDLSGGWFDAGDFNKYVTFTDEPLHDLMWAYQDNPAIFTDNWDIPESGNGIPDILDEIKWELEWLLKMNNADGSTHNKVGSQDYSDNTLTPPSLNTDTRYYGNTCSSASVCVAGIFAHAAKIFENLPGQATFAQELENSAISSWNYVLPMLNNNTLETTCDEGILSGDPNVLDIISGDSDLSASAQRDKAVKAAVHLFDLTGNTTYNAYVVNNYASTEQLTINYWSGYKRPLNEALMHYTTLTGNNATVSTAITNSLTAAVTGDNDNVFGYNDLDLYRAHMPNEAYHWGSTKPKAGFGLLNNLVVKYNIDIANNPSYVQKSATILNNFHGVNPLGIVYLTNMYAFGAERSINEIYHQWFGDASDWDNALTSLYGPAPGYVPGGPNPGYSGTYSPPLGQPEQKAYLDYNESTNTNPSWEISEPSITYQGPFVRLISLFATAAPSCAAAGTICDDGDPATTNDQEDGFCICAGTLPAGACDLITNGTFDVDLTDWNFWGCTPVANNGAAEIANIVPGTNPWDAGFFQSDLTFESGKSYVIQFEASAATNRDMVLKVGLGVSPFTTFYTVTVPLTTVAQQFTYNFTMTAPTTLANFELQIGSDAATVFLDDVSVTDLGCCPASGTSCDDGNPLTINDQEDGQCNCAGNLPPGACEEIQNGTFDVDLTDWDFWSCAPVVTNGEAEIANIVAGSNPWDVGFFQNDVPLQNGTSYTIEFDAYAAANRNVVLKIGLGISPFTTFYSTTVPLTTTSQSFTYTFTMNSATTLANFEFQIGANASTVFLDNVSLQEDGCVQTCPDFLTVTSPVAPGIHQAAIELTSGVLINGPISFEFKAGQAINLSPGFETGTNVEFTATIENCSN